VDAKKTRLVELLDAKLEKVEKRNVQLVEMMEQMVKEKEVCMVRSAAGGSND